MARKTPDAIQQYRGTTAQHAAYTGKVGELTVDTDKKVVVVHDGSTAGGIPMAREDRKVTGDTHLKVNGSTEGTLAGDVTLTVDMTSLAMLRPLTLISSSVPVTRFCMMPTARSPLTSA